MNQQIIFHYMILMLEHLLQMANAVINISQGMVKFALNVMMKIKECQDVAESALLN